MWIVQKQIDTVEPHTVDLGRSRHLQHRFQGDRWFFGVWSLAD
jgi:hypothetical protein